MTRTDWKRAAGTGDTFAISGFLAGIRTHIFASPVRLLDRPAIEPLLMSIENFLACFIKMLILL